MERAAGYPNAIRKNIGERVVVMNEKDFIQTTCHTFGGGAVGVEPDSLSTYQSIQLRFHNLYSNTLFFTRKLNFVAELQLLLFIALRPRLFLNYS